MFNTANIERDFETYLERQRGAEIRGDFLEAHRLISMPPIPMCVKPLNFSDACVHIPVSVYEAMHGHKDFPGLSDKSFPSRLLERISRLDDALRDPIQKNLFDHVENANKILLREARELFKACMGKNKSFLTSQDKEGNGIVFWCVYLLDTEALSTVLNMGADSSLKNSLGIEAFDLEAFDTFMKDSPMTKVSALKASSMRSFIEAILLDKETGKGKTGRKSRI